MIENFVIDTIIPDITKTSSNNCLLLSIKYFRSRPIGLNTSAKTGENPRIFPNFQNCARYEKATLSENCSLLGTNNVRGQIS